MTDSTDISSQVDDTGHEWDGIRELKNPCPRWWLNSLWLSGVLVLVYFILYPSLPLVEDSTKGLRGWTQIKEYKESLAEVEAMRKPFEEKLATMSAEEILHDKEILSYVIGSTKVLFGDNCAACHGNGGAPVASSGYPNLTDDDWLYGGQINEIMMSIANGRAGMMMAHEKILTSDEVDQLVQFVIDSSNGTPTEAGKVLFTAKGCVSCHGADAKGIKAMGSANLTDKIWRFSGDPQEIRYTILYGVNDASNKKTRVAVMPQWSEKVAVMMEAIAFAIEDGDDPNEIDWDDELDGDESERLTENDIKKLAVYVHQFGGGQ